MGAFVRYAIRAVGIVVVISGLVLSASLLSADGEGRAVAQTACPSTTTPGPPPPGGAMQVCYPSGWNLVGGPDTFAFPVPIWVWDPIAGQYKQYPAFMPFGPAGIGTGQGAWAYFAQATAVTIPGPPSNTPVSIPLVARRWQQIGNPFRVAGATVCGAGLSAFVFTYDPAAGTYSQITTLKQGQGAWVYATTGGSLTLVPTGVPGVTCPSS